VGHCAAYLRPQGGIANASPACMAAGGSGGLWVGQLRQEHGEPIRIGRQQRRVSQFVASVTIGQRFMLPLFPPSAHVFG